MNMKPLAIFLLSLILATASPASQAPELVPGYWERTPLPQRGLATYYAEGVMDYVWNYRRERNQLPDCPECVGAVALLRAGDIGRKIWITPPYAPDQVFGPFLVVDCAHTGDIPMLLSREWVVDLSYELGRMWNMTGPVMDFVVWADPAEDEEAPVARPTLSFIPPEDVIITMPTPPGAPPDLPPTDAQPQVASEPLPLPMATQLPAMDGPALITTPTPPGGSPARVEATDEPLPARAAATEEAALVREPAPSPTPGEVALGRAGGLMLGDGADVAATPRVRVATTSTPRPTSPPILPPSAPRPPVPLPPPHEPSPLEQIWQVLVHLIGR